jgi:hypothetical protein
MLYILAASAPKEMVDAGCTFVEFIFCKDTVGEYTLQCVIIGL